MSAGTGIPSIDGITAAALRPAAAQIMQRCNELAKCSDAPGQLTRLFCSPAMKLAHEKLRAWFAAAGMQCRLDGAGNLIGRLACVENANSGQSQGLQPLGLDGAKTLLIGSHLDTVVDAGRYDGMLGVLLGLALAELASETNTKLPFALEVVAFSEEEGVRYRTPYIGSRALVGDLTAELLQKRDADGISMAEALQSFSCAVHRIAENTYAPEQILAYLEPHIEQGPVLEAAGLPVGIVTGIAGQTRARFQFIGRAGHAGTAPMGSRHDALAAAAEFIGQVEQLARHREGLTATVGQIQVVPNVANVIPGEVNLSLDVRHLDDEAREAAFREMTHQAALIAEEREIEFDLTSTQHHPAVKCDARLTDQLRQAVVETGLKPLDLPSGAGHDAVMMACRFPVAMLFVRCAGGISHHPDESVTESDVAVALAVLWRLVLKWAVE